MTAKDSEKNIYCNLLKLVSGEGIGRVIGILATPIIARIYGPADMGVLAVFVSTVAIIAPFACFCYSSAIAINPNSLIAMNLVGGCFLLLSVTTIVTYLLIGFFSGYVLEQLSMQALMNYWWLIPLGVFFRGCYDILTQYNIRIKAFSNIARSTVLQRLSGAFFKILLGFLNIKPLGLLIGDILTSSGGVSVLVSPFIKDFSQNYKTLSLHRIRFCFQKYISFPKFRLPSQALLQLSGNLPIFFFAWKFNDVVIGQIGLARTMLSIPVTLIGTSVGRAFLGEIAQIGIQDSELIYKITIDVIKKLFFVSLLPFITIIIFGPFIFQIVFGEEWYDSGIYARLLAVYLIFQFMYSPIEEGIFNVYEKQHLVLLIEIFRISIIAIVLMTAYYFDMSAFHTVFIYSFGLALQYIFGLITILCVLQKSKRNDQT